MQLVPLSTDGRVTAVCGVLPAPGPLQVALEPDGDGVGIIALGPGTPRPIGRLAPADVSTYAPVLRGLLDRGLVGTCPARVAAGRTLVLDLAPASGCVLGNVPGDLVLLAAERTVTVTREEHHQDVLAGRSGRVAVGLQPSPVSGGKYAGLPGLAVTLDGRRVGELTRMMAQRYLPTVQSVAARGRRAGCEALLRADHRGVQVELRLPAVDEAAGSGTPPPPAPRPLPVGPRPTAVGPAVVPMPAALPPSPPLPTGRPQRGRRRIVWAGVAVVGLLAFAGAVGNDGQPASRPTTVAAEVTPTTEPAAEEPTSTSAAPSSTTTASAAPTGTARADTDRAAGAAERTSARTTTRTTPLTARSTATPSTRTSTPEERAPEPSRRTREVEPGPSRCHPSYSPCLPVGPDLDCGDIDGQVVVKGPDEYRLDANHDGIGCNAN